LGENFKRGDYQLEIINKKKDIKRKNFSKMNFKSLLAFLLVILLVSASATDLYSKTALKKSGTNLGLSCGGKH